MLALKIKFSLSHCFGPLFSRETCFSQQWPRTGVYLFTEGCRGVSRDGTPEPVPGISGSLGWERCFLVTYFQFERTLVLLESLPGLHRGSRCGPRGQWSCTSLSKQRGWRGPRQGPLNRGPLQHEAFPSPPSSQCGWEQLEFHTEGTPQLFPHSCFLHRARVGLCVLNIFDEDHLPRNHLQA